MLKQLMPFAITLLAIVGTPCVHAEADDQDMGIADLLFEIRSELIEAENRMKKAGRTALFVTKKLDLELSFVVEESVSGKGGFDIRIVTLGAEKDYSTAKIQKIRLQLETPIPPLTAVTPSAWKEYFESGYLGRGAFSHEIPPEVHNWIKSEKGWKIMNEISKFQQLAPQQ